jgi:hypothetical protein
MLARIAFVTDNKPNMSAEVSTVKHFGTGFERSGFPFTSWLKESLEFAGEEFEGQVSQLPRRKRVSPTKRGFHELRFCSPSDVLRSWQHEGEFEGLLLIPDAPFGFPPQRFTVSSTGMTLTPESHPTDAWPQILIDLKYSADTTPTVERFMLRPSGNTVEAEIMYTRVLLTLGETGSCFLVSEITPDNQVIGISFSFQPFSVEVAQSILYRGKIARKLRFLESVFNLQLTLPENITPDHVQYLETIFRGLTEGQFVSRGTGIRIFLRAADIDLSKPPFSEVGTFEHYSGAEQALLYPQRVLDVGPYYLILKNAVVANRMELTPLREGKDSWVRFEVLDGQIGYRYERYTRPDAHRRVQQKLRRFHSRLISGESPSLADAVFDPLISNVLSDEAFRIAAGWLEYNSLPDRFSPQDPILDEERACWRVPIHLVYANGQGAPVGELRIDLKTGEIVEEPGLETLNQKAQALAEKIFRVS